MDISKLLEARNLLAVARDLNEMNRECPHHKGAARAIARAAQAVINNAMDEPDDS